MNYFIRYSIKLEFLKIFYFLILVISNEFPSLHSFAKKDFYYFDQKMKAKYFTISILFLFFLLSNSSSIINKAGEKAEEVYDTIKEGIQHGKNVAEETLSGAGDYIKETFHKGKDMADESLEALRDTGINVKHRGQEDLWAKANRKYEELKDLLEELGM